MTLVLRASTVFATRRRTMPPRNFGPLAGGPVDVCLRVARPTQRTRFKSTERARYESQPRLPRSRVDSLAAGRGPPHASLTAPGAGIHVGAAASFNTTFGCAPRETEAFGLRAAKRLLVVLRNLDEPHGRREVRARRHAIPDLVEVSLQVLLECRQSLAVHARSTSVRLYPLEYSPDELLRNIVRLCFRHRLLPLPVDRHPPQARRDPFAPPALPGFIDTTGPSAPPPRIGTRLLMGPPLGGLPSHRGGRFPRSTQEPAPSSRHFHAGHRSGSRQAPPELHPRPTTGAWFRWHPYAFDTSSAVHSRSPSRRSPDGLVPPFPSRSPPRPLDQSSIRWFETRSCNPVPRGQPSSLAQQGCFESAATSRPPLRAVVAHSRPRNARRIRRRAHASFSTSGPTGRARSEGRCSPEEG